MKLVIFRMSKTWRLALISVLVAAFTGMTAGAVELQGADAEAIAYAFKIFKRSYPKAQLKNFTVEVAGNQYEIEVIFVPNPTPRPTTSSGSDHVLSFGGSTVFGEEVHYHMSRKPLKLLRTTYGR